MLKLYLILEFQIKNFFFASTFKHTSLVHIIINTNDIWINTNILKFLAISTVWRFFSDLYMRENRRADIV